MATFTATLTLPDGRVFPFRAVETDYNTESIEFYYTDGNGACDCALADCLRRDGHDVPEMECGTRIVMSDIKVED